MRVDENTKEVLKTWPLTTVRRWAASPNSFTLVGGSGSGMGGRRREEMGEEGGKGGGRRSGEEKGGGRMHVMLVTYEGISLCIYSHST